MSSPDRFNIGLVVVVYVLPLGAAVALLFAAGLHLIAGSLIVIEAGVAGAVLLAKRPARPRATGPRPGWWIPAAMVGILLALVGVAMLAARLG